MNKWSNPICPSEIEKLCWRRLFRAKVDLDVPAILFRLCFSVLRHFHTGLENEIVVLCAHVSRLISRDDFSDQSTCEGNSHHYHHHHQILLSLYCGKGTQMVTRPKAMISWVSRYLFPSYVANANKRLSIFGFSFENREEIGLCRAFL